MALTPLSCMETQIYRLMSRGWALWLHPGQQHHYGRPDAHDNNWLLLELLLAVPLVLGLKVLLIRPRHEHEIPGPPIDRHRL
jgi:hypothetical protein